VATREGNADTGNGGNRSRGPVAAEDLTIVPASRASWADLQAIFGTTEQGRCNCQRFKTKGWFWAEGTDEGRRQQFRDQVNCDDPEATSTTGLVAYLREPDGTEVPVGWVAVEPRTEYPKILSLRRTWTGRPDEDKTDDSVWSVTCFVVRQGYRKRGITYALAAATIPYAKANGARAVEGYPMITQPGKEVTWGELHVGARQVFEEAGFTQVSHPTPRRVVMRVDFGRGRAERNPKKSD
jgi:GNAT superfamily N-acetyltransferase